MGQASSNLRLLSPEPVLAEILAKRKPVLIGEEGYYWLVGWIATIGTILRSREHIAGLIVSTIDMILLNGATSIVGMLAKRHGVGGVILRLFQ